MNYQVKDCPCQADAIPCESCADAMEASMSWMAPMARANVESLRAGSGPTSAGVYYGQYGVEPFWPTWNEA